MAKHLTVQTDSIFFYSEGRALILASNHVPEVKDIADKAKALADYWSAHKDPAVGGACTRPRLNIITANAAP